MLNCYCLYCKQYWCQTTNSVQSLKSIDKVSRAMMLGLKANGTWIQSTRFASMCLVYFVFRYSVIVLLALLSGTVCVSCKRQHSLESGTSKCRRSGGPSLPEACKSVSASGGLKHLYNCGSVVKPWP